MLPGGSGVQGGASAGQWAEVGGPWAVGQASSTQPDRGSLARDPLRPVPSHQLVQGGGPFPWPWLPGPGPAEARGEAASGRRWEAARTQDRLLGSWAKGAPKASILPPWFFKIIMYAQSAAKGGFEAANPLFYK